MRVTDRRIVATILTLSLFTGTLPTITRKAKAANAEKSQGDNETEKKGLQFRLSQGSGQTEPAASIPVASTTVLSATETENLLKRLPELKSSAGDEESFNPRGPSLLPPRTGKTISASFPGPSSMEMSEFVPARLQVLRASPQGNAQYAPNLSVTFSQPMVAIGSQEGGTSVPVRLSPQPPGKWRWLGTKTLAFEPEVRFPMATDYSVIVPSDTRSTDGSRLGLDKRWTFSTPPPTITKSFPGRENTQNRNPLLFVEFDQRIDPDAVVKTIKLRAGKSVFSARLATSEEVRANDEIKTLAEHAAAGHWLAFNVAGDSGSGALPAGAKVIVSIGPGTPSAEGPKRTIQAQTFSFTVFGPLRVTVHQCDSDRPNQCMSDDDLDIKFNNSIDKASIADSLVKVEPSIEKMSLSIVDDTLSIEGVKKTRTAYRVRLDPKIKDSFGQALGVSRPMTFFVGPREPVLSAPEKLFAVLNPFAPAKYSIYTINYSSAKYRLYSVQPENYQQWFEHQHPPQGKKIAPIPGRLVHTETIPIRMKQDQIVETSIDLGPALTDGHGQMILVVESPEAKRRFGPYYRIEVWLQRTGIGLDAFVDKTDVLGWVTSLRDGSQLSNVELALMPFGAKGTTGVDGTARLSLPAKHEMKANLLVGRSGSDTAILPEQTDRWEKTPSWFRNPELTSLRWFVFDDRKIYRPTEEVSIKGWIRRLGAHPLGDVGLPDNSYNTTAVVYTVKDSSDVEIARGGTQLSPLGGFNFSIKLPGNMNLGNTQVELLTNSNLTESNYTHRFRVEEFRRPEFEVESQTDTSGPYLVGSSAELSVNAKYYSGGGLPEAPVSWQVVAIPSQFTPPNRSDFTFGKWASWWNYSYDRTITGQTRRETFESKTDQDGKHRLHVDFDSVNPPRPTLLNAEATVTDVNRQTWSSITTLLVHPADLYVGLRSSKTFVQQGQPLVVESIVTDLEGHALPQTEVKMRAALLEWKPDPKKSDSLIQVEKNPQDCTLISTSETSRCSFQTIESGQYRVLATIHDQRGRANQTELMLWVAGEKAASEESYSLSEVTLIPDRKEYRGGDTAEILLQAHLYPAEGIVTLLRSGVLKTESFHMNGPTHTLRIPIEAAWTPNVTVQVHLAGSLDRGKGKEPASAAGSLSLPIPPLDRKLQVTAEARQKVLEPGGETEISVDVKNASGGPVTNSEVTVIAVDESVLALTDYQVANPLNTFYSERSPDTSHLNLREELLVPAHNAEEREQFISEYWRRIGNGYGVGGGAGGASFSRMSAIRGVSSNFGYIFEAGKNKNVVSLDSLSPIVTKSGSSELEESKPIRVRENFSALALFAPSVRTDGNGHASVRLKLPDNLTRYRVMAVAVAGGKYFGSSESYLTAQIPLMVRPSAPRFLNIGDQFELPIVIQNQTGQAVTADVAVRAVNAGFVDGAGKAESANRTAGWQPAAQAGRRVSVPANDRVEIRIPATTVKPGLAHFQLSVASGQLSDAAAVSLPVWTPVTAEAFATYGQLDEGAITQTVTTPNGVFKEYGGLEVETSSTQLQELTDAVIYLTHYPYECSEQLSSRIIGIAALRDVLTSFHSKELPSPSELEAIVARDLKGLEGMQGDDGGFGFWTREDHSWPYLTIHVAHALARAKQKKFIIAPVMLEKVRKYLRSIDQHIPDEYGPDARRGLLAYALYTRAQLGDRDTARARKLIATAGLANLSLESVGWLLSVLAGDKASQPQVDMIRRHLANRVTETASTAHFVSDYKDGNYLLLNSDERTDGVILEALIADQKESDLIPKLVRGLLERRTRGRWENTQENAFVLLALDRYFNTYEKATPDFVARMWLGNDYAGEQRFAGRVTDRQEVNVPMSYLLSRPRTQTLTLSKEGNGRLYYRIGMNYAPSDMNLKPVDSGFTIERTYESIDHSDDVRRDADGSWKIKAGARVRVSLTMFAQAERYHVALTDPLPAGFETVNPTLAISQSAPSENEKHGAGYPQLLWFDHQNLRDERAEAFTARLWPGVYRYSYVARATTPGNFNAGPAKVEEMYHPETFARGKTDHVRIA